MATSVDAKLLKSTKFPPEFNQKVDMKKVNIEVMKKWIAGEISQILGDDDDVVIELCFNLLEGSRFPNIKHLQIQLTGFLEKDTPKFCEDLWKLCISAQESVQGVPKELLEAKKQELKQEKLDAARAAEEARHRRDIEFTREHNVQQIRQREWDERGERGYRGDGGRFRRRGAYRGGGRRDYSPNRSHARRSQSPPRRRRASPDRTFDTYIPAHSRGGRLRVDASDRPRRDSRSASIQSDRRRLHSRSRSPSGDRRRRRRHSTASSDSRSVTPERRRQHGGRRRSPAPRARRAHSRSRSSSRARDRSLSPPDRRRSPSPRRSRRRNTSSPSQSPSARSMSGSRSHSRHDPASSRSRSRSVSSARSVDRTRDRSRSNSPVASRGSNRQADTRKDPSHANGRRRNRSSSPSRSPSRSQSREVPKKRRRSLERYEPRNKRRVDSNDD